MQTQRVVSISLIGVGLLANEGVVRAAARDASRARASLASADRDGTCEDEPGRYSPAPREHTTRFQLGLGAGLTLGLGDVWEGNGDVRGSSGGPLFLDLSVTPSYRVTRDVALGVRAGVGLEPGSRGEASTSGESLSLDRRLWHASALGRYQADPGRGWYVALSLGAAAIVDSLGNESSSQWAPLIGAAAGYDLRVARPLSLGLELRAAYADFGDGARLSPARSYDYDVSTWIGAGVVASILP